MLMLMLYKHEAPIQPTYQPNIKKTWPDMNIISYLEFLQQSLPLRPLDLIKLLNLAALI